MAAALGAGRREVVFTGGGTEADNLAVLGRWRAARRAGSPGPVVCSAVEHKAVLGAVREAGREGAEVVYLAVDEEGRVLLDAVDEALAARPSVVSVMWGNNEVGTLQPVAEVAEPPWEEAMALGWAVGTYAGHRTLGHSGADPGFGSRFVVLPEARTGVVVLANSNTVPTGTLTAAAIDVALATGAGVDGDGIESLRAWRPTSRSG